MEENIKLLSEIKEKLTNIESLLQRLPEIQAAVHFTMQDQFNSAKLQGRKAKDIWDIIPPQKR